MWVKICGNTTLADAVHASEAGADAVGFVFATSRRQVTSTQVAAITPYLPAHVERIGVFDSPDAVEIARVATEAGLTAVQLHCGVDQTLLDRLAAFLPEEIGIIQALHWIIEERSDRNIAERLSGELNLLAATGRVDRALIDSKVGSASGGTGVAYNWDAARALFLSAPAGLNLIVAGGLRPSNVAVAIAELHPWGVDVSSGVEAEPGSKSPTLVEEFVKNARV